MCVFCPWRKNTDHTDCDGETDLQGLVSNILDEADSHDSYSEGYDFMFSYFGLRHIRVYFVWFMAATELDKNLYYLLFT